MPISASKGRRWRPSKSSLLLRSASVTRPTKPPSRSTTGRPLTPKSSIRSAVSLKDVVESTVITMLVIKSRTFTHAPFPNARPFPE